MFMDRKMNIVKIVKMAILPKLSYSFNSIPTKTEFVFLN